MKEKWDKARPMNDLYKKYNGETYPQIMEHVTLIDYRMAPYGDWSLYEEEDGTLYEDYFSIGD